MDARLAIINQKYGYIAEKESTPCDSGSESGTVKARCRP